MSTVGNLKKLSNQELDHKLKCLAAKERELLGEVIFHIAEIATRKLYLQWAYPSLFEYLTKHVGYSAGGAQRRIDAARLFLQVPELKNDIETGQINLNQISFLQKSIRAANSKTNESEEKVSKTNANRKHRISLELKKSLLEALKNKTFRESEILVKLALNVDVVEAPKVSFQKDASVRFEVTVSSTQWEKLLRMRELIAHSLPDGSWDQVLEYVSDQVIQQKDKARSLDPGAKRRSSDPPSAREQKENPAGRTAIARGIQREVFKRDQCCQFVDPLSQKKCESKWKLTLDHIQPVWAGGQNAVSNLRVLCANHNVELYRQQSGLRSPGH